MARPKNADGQRTRQAILDAALQLFGDKGYFGTSLRDVAGAVGVRESALYNYFPGKEALFASLLTEHEAARAERLAGFLEREPGPARAALERLTLVMLDDYVEPRQAQLFRILMSDGLRLARDGRINLVERMSAVRPRLSDVLAHLTRHGRLRRVDPQILVPTFLGPLLLWRQMHAIGAPLPFDGSRPAFAKAHVIQFLEGAAAPARPASRPRRRPVARTRQERSRATV